MSTKKQRIRAGLFVAATAAVLAIVLVVFGGMRFWEGRDRYRIEFEGSVMGLENGARVYLNGLRVGAVESIRVSPDDPQYVRVVIAIRGGTPIHTDTRATMPFAGITGLKVIDLRGGSVAAGRLAPGEKILPGQTVLDKFEAQARVVVDQTVILMTRANQIVDNLVQITEPKRFADITGILAQTRIAATNLVSTTRALQALVAENRLALGKSIAAVRETAEGASSILDGEVAQLVTNMSDLVGDLRGFVRGNEGTLRATMSDLRQASRSFRELAREVRQRPSRLLYSPPPANRRHP